MRLHKTPKAREVLGRNGPELSQLERRILILCDGRRDTATLLEMLGAEAAGCVDVMREQGYLVAAAPPPEARVAAVPQPERAMPLGPGFNRLLEGVRGRTGKTARPVVAPPKATAPGIAMVSEPHLPANGARPSGHAVSTALPGTPPSPRRSLSAAKMYMLDMLQLQRSMEASSIAVSIQTSCGETALVTTLLDGLAHLASTTKPSMSGRIASRLAEILPESHLDALDRCWSGVAPQPDATPFNVIPMGRYA